MHLQKINKIIKYFDQKSRIWFLTANGIIQFSKTAVLKRTLNTLQYIPTYIPTYMDARWYIFKPKNPNLGKFWRVLQWKMLIYFIATWSILQPFRIFYCRLVYFPPFWYVASRKIWQHWLHTHSTWPNLYLRRVNNEKTLWNYFVARCTNVQILEQDCQIFLGSNIPKLGKLYQRTTNYVHQTAIHYTKWP
jgi:hypothetical protein